MTAIRRTTEAGAGSVAVAVLGRFIARVVYGTPLAADPVWRSAHQAEQAARKRHQERRSHQAAKTARLHAALEAGRAR